MSPCYQLFILGLVFGALLVIWVLAIARGLAGWLITRQAARRGDRRGG